MKFDKKFLMNKRDFEAREVFNPKGLKKQLETTGYEAFRVSPRTTTKFGQKYKKIYGATVEPDHRRILKKNKHGYGKLFGAEVKFYPHGYTKANVKGGTRLLGSLKYYPVDQQEAKRKLMLKSRKKR